MIFREKKRYKIMISEISKTALKILNISVDFKDIGKNDSGKNKTSSINQTIKNALKKFLIFIFNIN